MSSNDDEDRTLDAEQLELGSSDEFWRMISERRQERTIGATEPRQRIDELRSGPTPDSN